jgi:hypothetical protein
MKTLFILTALSINVSTLFANKKADLTVFFTKTDVTCAGSNNGSIQLIVSGGKAPYTVTWKNGSDQFELSNLRGGLYTAVVKDASGEKTTQDIVIEEPTPLGFSYRSNEYTEVETFNSVMNISVFGGSPFDQEGTMHYFIRLNGQSYYEHPEKLENGLYTLSIEDAKGCTFSLKVNLNISVVPSAQAIQTAVISTTEPSNSFGVIDMIVVHNDLINSSILQQLEKEENKDFSIK